MLKFSCEKTLLQQAVSTVSRAVAAKSSIPALEGVLLEGDTQLTLSGYNMQTGIRTAISAEIHQEGRIVLNARLFGEMIRRLPDDIVVFSADEKYVVKLVCGDASFELPGLSADDYPELPTVDDEFSVSIQQNTMKAMINQTSFAVSTNEARPIHGADHGGGGRIPSGSAAGAAGAHRRRRVPFCGAGRRPQRGGEDLRRHRRAADGGTG